MRLLMAGCVMKRRSAAAEKEPVSATAIKAVRVGVSIIPRDPDWSLMLIIIGYLKNEKYELDLLVSEPYIIHQ